jgi:neurotransmitter:Na+ symporter, NSS family
MEGQRERWNSRASFILAAVGSAIGLGNVWRFPFIAYKNGGGAFLIPYFFALLTAGIPVLILEMAIGQQFQSAAPGALKKAKSWFEFVGWFAILVAMVIVFYYCVVMAWSINYLVYSFTMAWKGDEANFFNNTVLHITEGPGQLGGLSPWLLIALAITWIGIYFCVWKGVESVGKVVWVSVTLPLVLLAIMFLRGVTLPGALDGILLYLTPDWSALSKPSVWAAAYGQIFFTLSVGFGVMSAYASFRPKNTDIVNCAFITGLSNSGVEFFAGFAVFAVIGFMANQLGVSVSSIEDAGVKIAGPGLAFITYAKAIAMLPAAQQLFGVLFFVMLFSLGIDSAFSLTEAASTALADKLHLNRFKANLWLCVIGFLGGILFVSGAGMYWLDIVDHWMNQYGLVVVSFLECLFLGWFFNIKWLSEQMDKYAEIRTRGWWVFMVKYVTPIILGLIILSYLGEEMSKPYEGYPAWALWIGGWGLTLILLVLGIMLSWTTDTGKVPAKALWLGASALVFVLAIFFLLYPVDRLTALTPWIMALVGSLILYGGLTVGLTIAVRESKKPPKPEEGEGKECLPPPVTM